MPTLNVVLTDSQAQFVKQKLAALREAVAVVLDNMELSATQPLGTQVLHVARYGKRGRHFLVFSAAEGGTIDVLRVLHDSMDLAQHLAH